MSERSVINVLDRITCGNHLIILRLQTSFRHGRAVVISEIKGPTFRQVARVSDRILALMMNVAMGFTRVTGISALANPLTLSDCFAGLHRDAARFQVGNYQVGSCFQADHDMVAQRRLKIIREYPRCHIGFSVMRMGRCAAHRCDHWDGVTTIIFQLRARGQVRRHPQVVRPSLVRGYRMLAACRSDHIMFVLRPICRRLA